MALQLLQLNKLSCALCLKVFQAPATLPCGHCFCLGCIDGRWDEQKGPQGCTCPTCSTTFKPRPVLVASAAFAALVEELTSFQTSAAADSGSYASDDDVACDVCKGKKLKSAKSCLVCRASYCELHLQPHYESPAFMKHRLVAPCNNLAQSICPHHDEALKMYCQDDQQVICFLCSVDEHKTHKTVSAATERTKKLDQLGALQKELRRKVEAKERDVAALRNETDAIAESADAVAADSEDAFGEVLPFVEKVTSRLREHIRRQEELEIARVKEIQGKLEEDILELRRKDAELDQLADVHDYGQFFEAYQTVPCVDDQENSRTTNTRPLKYFADITVALSDMRDRLQDVLTEECARILRKVPDVDVLLPTVEPDTRQDFLQYSIQVTLDPNSVNAGLLLSEGNRKASVAREAQRYADHSERFADCLQVLSRHRVTGRCYWEVGVGKGGATVAVSYKSVPRTGESSAFGSNDKSWALNCFDQSFYFRHNDARMFIAGPRCEKVGVYVNERAGALSFYAVGKRMTLLHRVEAEFAEPLHAGVGLYWVGDSAQMC